MRYTLKAEIDHETSGELGWLPEHAREGYWPTTDPLLIAHDLLEHTSLRDVEDEARAVGAIYFGRYTNGYVSPTRAMSRSLALEDIASDFEFGVWRPSRLDGIDEIKSQRKLDVGIETDLAEIVRLGKKVIRDEYENQGEDVDSGELDAFGDTIANYFRQGYRRANRRYGSRNRLTYLFYEVESLFAEANNKPEFEGQRITLNIPFRAGDITLRPVEDAVY